MNTRKLLKANAKVLLYLRKHNCDPNIRNYIINSADKNLISCFSKIAINLLQKHINLSHKQLKNLKNFRTQMHILSSKTSIKQKKKVLQTGGFLPAILAPIASILASIIGGVIKK